MFKIFYFQLKALIKRGISFLLIFTIHLSYTMEHGKTEHLTLPEEIFFQEILKNHLDIYTNLNIYANSTFVLNQAEDFFAKQELSEDVPWTRYRWYFPSDTIFLKDENATVYINLEKYFHFKNVFKPLDRLANEIKLAQKFACINKKMAENLRTPLFNAKIFLAQFILTQTSYKDIIANIVSYNKTNFFLRPTHYIIANALGNAFSYRNHTNLTEDHYKQIHSLIEWGLWASCYAHANQPYFSQKTETDMLRIDMPTNERLNKFTLNLLGGMIQYSENNKYTLQFETFRKKEGATITDTNYIKNTAKNMKLDLDISFHSFFFKTPDIVTIEITGTKNNILSDCSIQ